MIMEIMDKLESRNDIIFPYLTEYLPIWKHGRDSINSVDGPSRIEIYVLMSLCITIFNFNISHQADRVFKVYPSTIWLRHRVSNHPLNIFRHLPHFLDRIRQELILLLYTVVSIASYIG